MSFGIEYRECAKPKRPARLTMDAWHSGITSMHNVRPCSVMFYHVHFHRGNISQMACGRTGGSNPSLTGSLVIGNKEQSTTPSPAEFSHATLVRNSIVGRKILLELRPR
jgi:hypothetical protein